MTGNLHVLLLLARGIVPFLPTVGPAAARSSKTIARRASLHGSALFGRAASSLRRLGKIAIAPARPARMHRTRGRS